MRAIVYFSMAFLLSGLLVYSPITADLFAFLLTGAIPGTNMAVSANSMLIGYICAVVLVIIHFTGLNIQHARTVRRLIRRQLTARERLPRRRYSELSS